MTEAAAFRPAGGRAAASMIYASGGHGVAF